MITRVKVSIAFIISLLAVWTIPFTIHLVDYSHFKDLERIEKTTCLVQEINVTAGFCYEDCFCKPACNLLSDKSVACFHSICQKCPRACFEASKTISFTIKTTDPIDPDQIFEVTEIYSEKYKTADAAYYALNSSDTPLAATYQCFWSVEKWWQVTKQRREYNVPGGVLAGYAVIGGISVGGLPLSITLIAQHYCRR